MTCKLGTGVILLDNALYVANESLYLTGLWSYSCPRNAINVFSWTAVVSH